MRTSLLATLTLGATAAPHNAVKILDSSDSLPFLGQVESFTFPQVGGTLDGNAIFQGMSASKSALLVLQANGGGFVDGINATTPVQAGSGLSGFGDFDLARVGSSDPGVAVAFTSTLGAVDGVFVQRPNGDIVTVATTADTFAPAGGTFSTLNQPTVAVSDDGSTIHVGFVAWVNGGSWRGLITAEVPMTGTADVELTVVANSNTTVIPGTPDMLFLCLLDPVISANGDLVFFGSHCGSSGSTAVQNERDSQIFFKSRPRSSHCLTRNRGVTMTNVYPTVARWSKASGKLEPVINFNSTVPGGASGETFVAFSPPAVGADGTVAMTALSSQGTYGVFKVAPTGDLTLVAGTTTPYPTLPEITFGDFPNPPSVGSNGEVVFYGSASQYGGVFAGTDSGLVAGVGLEDEVDGQKLQYIGFGTDAYSSSSGKYVAYLVLEDTTAGIWSFEFPSTAEVI